MRIEDRLHRAVAPDAQGARERARRVILASAPERSRRRRAPLVMAVILLAGLAVTPPGDAVARWVRDLVRPDPPQAIVELGRLPAFGGGMLAGGPGGAYVITSDGSRRRLGDYTSATWSPHGRFITVTRDDVMRAVDPAGEVRWSLTASGPVTDPRWSPDGYRIAYRRDDDLRVIAGDGSGDHPLVDGVAMAAWRPGVSHAVAVGRTSGAVEMWSADSGARLWTRPAGLVRALAWRSDGRLVAVTDGRVLTLDGGTGATVARRSLPPGATRAALSRDGRHVALAYGRRVVTVGGRPADRLVTGAGIDSLTWSADGRTLLVTTDAQWYFLPAASGRINAATVRGIDRVTDWCCAVPAAG